MQAIAKRSTVTLARAGQAKPMAFVKPVAVRRLPNKPRAQAGAEASLEEEADVAYEPVSKAKLYEHDQITHSVTGEYSAAIFFTFWATIFLLPVVFPPFVLIFQWIHETFPNLWGGML